jgi:perosamine synthetase
MRGASKNMSIDQFIPVNQPLLDGNEKRYLNECIDTGWISSEGPFIKQFEQLVAIRMQRQHAVAVTNGTAAIDVVIEALGIGPGDEVIMPTFTIISCIAQIVRNGAIPVLVDCDPLTWNMDVSQIEANITPRTKAIMVVHIYGVPVDIDPVLDICLRHGLKLIEDAAELIGQTYRGLPCGSFGDVSTLSFYPNKHITTGEGGMIMTNDPVLAENLRELRNLCFKPPRRFVHERLGWNMRMTNLQAALGVAQMERLDQFLTKKRRIGAQYNELLGGLPGIQLPVPQTDFAENIYWVYGIVIDETLGDAEGVIDRLASVGIGARPFFYPMHQQPVLLKMGLFSGASFPNAERLYRQGLYLPSGLSLTDDQIIKVAQLVRKVLSVR